jgi:predicted ester cyclase
MKNIFNSGDRVVSKSKYSNDKHGVIWKITDEAVHVRFDDGLFEKFHFIPTHHMQTKIELLTFELNS